MKDKVPKTSSVAILISRLIVGLIFFSEGLQKFLTPDAVGAGRFAKIGFAHPEFWASFTGGFEIICGIFILIGFFIRFALISLLIIMAVAFVTTKFPLLSEKSILVFAHEYRTDFAMTLLLLFLFRFDEKNKFFYGEIFGHDEK